MVSELQEESLRTHVKDSAIVNLHSTPPILFAQAGLYSGEASFLASGVSAILMNAISIPAFLYADA